MDGLAGLNRSHSEMRSQSVANLRWELKETDLSRHLALFFRESEAQLEAVAAVIAHALRTDHQCLYLFDVNTPKQIKDALRMADVDVDAQVEAGNLILEDASAVYLDAEFDPEEMIETLQDRCERSVSDGYDGLWVVGENSWCFHTDVAFDHILDFESEFDSVCPDLPVRALCQYDLNRFGERSMAKALRTHEQVIYRHTICENPFYVPPEEYEAQMGPHENAQFMLEQAHSLTQARNAIDRREQRLSVLNRILRHNVRNDLNVVQGVLESLSEDEAISEDQQERVQTALAQVESVVEMSDRARYVQRTLSDPTVESLDLGAIIDDAVAAVEKRYPEADLRVRCDRDLRVLADVNIDRALLEVLTNAIQYQYGAPPVVTLTVHTPSEDTVRLCVRNPGPPIPTHERESIHQGRETELTHGSGLGLWLTKWIVENAHGSLEFPDPGDGDGQVVIELYRTR